MNCCDQNHPFFTPKNNDPIDYKQCLQLLAEQKDAQSFLRTLCQGVKSPLSKAGENTNTPPRPGFQCVIIPVRNLCQELQIFDLNEQVLNRIIKCTFVSIFNRLGVDLYHEIYNQYAPFFRTAPALDFTTFGSIFPRQLQSLYGKYIEFGKDSAAFYHYLVSIEELEQIDNCTTELQKCYIPVISYITKLKFLEELTEEFVRSELSICQKFLRIEIDLVILMTRLTELATNTEGGISGVTEALRRVSIGESNRYFEEKDFKDLFNAAEEIADVLEKIAKLYRERFSIFKELGDTLVCSRPQPPVKSIISEIPTLPPTVLI